jgi:crotonobetainyl-CoA:carnitine CoA-transferase CaiB-like acyl-CoA transferase
VVSRALKVPPPPPPPYRHFGAEIIKVEPPNTGDPLRVWRELDVDGTSPWFRSLARNKKSVSIDMRKEKGRAYVAVFLSSTLQLLNFFTNHFHLSSIVRRLADRSDVVIENFKPGSMCISVPYHQSIPADMNIHKSSST